MPVAQIEGNLIRKKFRGPRHRLHQRNHSDCSEPTLLLLGPSIRRVLSRMIIMKKVRITLRPATMRRRGATATTMATWTIYLMKKMTSKWARFLRSPRSPGFCRTRPLRLSLFWFSACSSVCQPSQLRHTWAIQWLFTTRLWSICKQFMIMVPSLGNITK